MKHSKAKEKEYIGRCNHYLDINKEVIKLSSKKAKQKNKKLKEQGKKFSNNNTQLLDQEDERIC